MGTPSANSRAANYAAGQTRRRLFQSSPVIGISKKSRILINMGVSVKVQFAFGE